MYDAGADVTGCGGASRGLREGAGSVFGITPILHRDAEAGKWLKELAEIACGECRNGPYSIWGTARAEAGRQVAGGGGRRGLEWRGATLGRRTTSAGRRRSPQGIAHLPAHAVRMVLSLFKDWNAQWYSIQDICGPFCPDSWYSVSVRLSLWRCNGAAAAGSSCPPGGAAREPRTRKERRASRFARRRRGEKSAG